MIQTDTNLIRSITDEASVIAQAIDKGEDIGTIIQQLKSPVAEIILNNYLKYSENGHSSLKSKRPSIGALRDWTLSKNLTNDNSSLVTIMQMLESDSLSAVPMIAKIKSNNL